MTAIATTHWAGHHRHHEPGAGQHRAGKKHRAGKVLLGAALMRAMAEASKAMHRDRELVYRVMEKKLRIKDRSILEASYNIEMKVMEPRLELKVPAIQPMIEEVAKTNPRANDVKPQDLMDRRYLAEMESSGFFNQLWNDKR